MKGQDRALSISVCVCVCVYSQHTGSGCVSLKKEEGSLSLAVIPPILSGRERDKQCMWRLLLLGVLRESARKNTRVLLVQCAASPLRREERGGKEEEDLGSCGVGAV